MHWADIHTGQPERDQPAWTSDLHHDVLIIVMEETHHAVLAGGGK